MSLPSLPLAAPRRSLSAVALVLLLVTACTGDPPAALRRSGESSPVATSAPAAEPAPYTVVGCDDAPPAFELLCETHELIRDEHVDAPEDGELAAAAADGVSADHATAREPFTCAVPADGFRTLCDALAVAGSVDEDLLEGAVRSMIAGSLDAYSAYQDPDERARASATIDGTVEGIGALVTSERVGSGDETGAARCAELSDSCNVVIVSLFDDSPAQRGGLQAGDRIVAVDGRPVDGDTLGGVVERVRGPAGSTVELTIARGERRLDIELTRAAVDVPVLETATVDDVGYLRLGLFTTGADEDLREALVELLRDEVDALVLDLRGNPGGSLDTAIGVTSEFLASGDVVRTESREADRSYRVERGGLATDRALELYVVLDEASASASEVVAGALQEAGRATVVGERSFGKDSVQQLFSLRDGGALKLTVARWLTPRGNGLGDGVTPDIELEIDADEPQEVVDAVLSAVAHGG